MTALRQRMLEELQRHNYSPETIRLYLFAVKDFARYFKRRPDLLTQEHMREFQLHLIKDRKLAMETVAGRITVLRFFFVKVLKRPYEELDLVYPKLPQGVVAPDIYEPTLNPLFKISGCANYQRRPLKNSSKSSCAVMNAPVRCSHRTGPSKIGESYSETPLP